MMACHLAVVAAHNGGDHEKAQRRHEIKLEHVDGTTTWWEALCNVYEVLQPSSATSPTRTCEGVRGDHFPPKSQDAFSRLCELAADEKARLDACMLSPGIAGILSHSVALPPGAEIRSSTDSPLWWGLLQSATRKRAKERRGRPGNAPLVQQSTRATATTTP